MSRSLQQPIFRLIKFHKLEKMAENLINIKAYLILVHHRTTGGGVLFSSRCTFFHKKRNKDCFQQSLLREICTSLVMKVCQIHQTKHQVRQTKSMHAKQNTKYAKKHQIYQTNTNYAKKNNIYANQNQYS